MMKRYGLIGYPLEHSFSPELFRALFKSEGLDDHDYRTYPLKSAAELPALVRDQHLLGFSVTIPYKQQVITFLDEISEEAQSAGAVNQVTVCWKGEEFRLCGFNTDIPAFAESLSGVDFFNRKALILGNGGACRAVIQALGKLGFSFTIVSRQPQEGMLGWDEAGRLDLKAYTLIVNTTPLGMFPEVSAFPPIPYETLSSQHLVYDLVYNPCETLFLKKAASYGARVKNGMEMLKVQAELAWEVWKNNRL